MSEKFKINKGNFLMEMPCHEQGPIPAKIMEAKEMFDNSILNTLIPWFERIEQMANDRKTGNGVVSNPTDILDEIKVYAKNCREYLELYKNIR